MATITFDALKFVERLKAAAALSESLAGQAFIAR